MKKIVLLWLLSVGLGFAPTAQSLESYFTSGATWTQIKRMYLNGGGINSYSAFRYYLDSDTVLNGQTYKKLNIARLDVLHQGSNSYSHVQQNIDNGLFGAIRTENQ